MTKANWVILSVVSLSIVAHSANAQPSKPGENSPVAQVLGRNCDHPVKEPESYGSMTLPSGERYSNVALDRVQVFVDGARVETVREVVRYLKRKQGKILNCNDYFDELLVQFPKDSDVGRVIEELRKKKKDGIYADPVMPPLHGQGTSK